MKPLFPLLPLFLLFSSSCKPSAQEILAQARPRLEQILESLKTVAAEVEKTPAVDVPRVDMQGVLLSIDDYYSPGNPESWKTPNGVLVYLEELKSLKDSREIEPPLRLLGGPATLKNVLSNFEPAKDMSAEIALWSQKRVEAIEYAVVLKTRSYVPPEKVDSELGYQGDDNAKTMVLTAKTIPGQWAADVFVWQLSPVRELARFSIQATNDSHYSSDRAVDFQDLPRINLIENAIIALLKGLHAQIPGIKTPCPNFKRDLLTISVCP